MQPEEQLIERATALARDGRIGKAAHMLRERLVLDPHNAPIRATIVAIYRDGGHHDQAARYSLGFGDYDPKAAHDYLQWLAAIGADEAQLRHLSVIPESIPIPVDLAGAIRARREARREPTLVEGLSDIALWAGGGLFFVCSFATLVAVYVVVIFGGAFARTVATAGGGVTAGAAAVTCGAIAHLSRKDGSVRAAIVFSAIAAVALVLCIAASVALLT